MNEPACPSVEAIELRVEGASLTFEPALGILACFAVRHGGRTLAPLHRAPWVGTDEPMPADAAPHLARLGGDFLCAPFGTREGGSPLHGWPPNSEWHVERADGGALHARLDRSVLSANVRKELTLREGHPFVYQRHLFEGGSGSVPVANHANVSVPDGAIIRTSPKLCWQTPPEPQESDPARGRSILCYPASATDPTSFPGRDGPVDLTRYPWGPCHEDFVIGIEAHSDGLGWTAVTRPEQGDLFLSLRDPRVLPVTMLWHSNGGRDYAPWSGRHRGCLGVEEGAAGHLLGNGDRPEPGALPLVPNGRTEIRHVIGALAWPSGEAVAAVRVEADALVVVGEHGAVAWAPLDATFLRP